MTSAYDLKKKVNDLQMQLAMAQQMKEAFEAKEFFEEEKIELATNLNKGISLQLRNVIIIGSNQNDKVHMEVI